MTRAFLLGVRWQVGTGKRISGGEEYLPQCNFVTIKHRIWNCTGWYVKLIVKIQNAPQADAETEIGRKEDELWGWLQSAE